MSKAIKAAIAELKRRQSVIAKERDKLRDLLDDVSELEDDCHEAIDGLETAIDALSRLQ